MISLLTTLLNNVILLLGNERALVRGGEGDDIGRNHISSLISGGVRTCYNGALPLYGQLYGVPH